MDEHEGEIGRSDPADAARVAQRPRPDTGELIARLGAEMPHATVVESLGDRPLREPLLPFDPLPIEGHLACVMDVVFDLHGHVPRHRGQFRNGGNAVAPGELRPLE